MEFSSKLDALEAKLAATVGTMEKVSEHTVHATCSLLAHSHHLAQLDAEVSDFTTRKSQLIQQQADARSDLEAARAQMNAAKERCVCDVLLFLQLLSLCSGY